MTSHKRRHSVLQLVSQPILGTANLHNEQSTALFCTGLPGVVLDRGFHSQLLLVLLVDQRFVDVRNHTTSSNGGLQM